jgi:hypothetical protein
MHNNKDWAMHAWHCGNYPHRNKARATKWFSSSLVSFHGQLTRSLLYHRMHEFQVHTLLHASPYFAYSTQRRTSEECFGEGWGCPVFCLGRFVAGWHSQAIVALML